MSVNVAEYIGFKTTASTWPTLIWPQEPAWTGGSPSLDKDIRVFIHGRDYSAKEPETLKGSGTTDSTTFIRVFDLLADNTFSVQGSVAGDHGPRVVPRS